MAILALHAKNAEVDFWLRVAGAALTGSILEALLCVAFLALQLAMGAVQYEEPIVVKITHPVDAIVAVQAGRAKLLLMLLQECEARCSFRMAGDTSGQDVCINRTGMAVCAGHVLPLVVDRVARQTEPGAGAVIEGLAFPDSRQPGIGSMTVLAGGIKKARVFLWFSVT